MKYCMLLVFRLEYFYIVSKVQGCLLSWLKTCLLYKKYSTLAVNKQSSNSIAGFPHATFVIIKTVKVVGYQQKYANENGDLDLSGLASLISWSRGRGFDAFICCFICCFMHCSG